MSNLEDIKNNAKSITSTKTETFIKQLSAKQKFHIKSSYPTINSINCELWKGDRCFNFSSGQILPLGPPAKYQNKGYGFEDIFELVNDQMTILVPKGVRSLQISIGKGFSSTGEIAELISSNLLKESYTRAIIPLSKFSKKPYEHIESKPFKSESWFRPAGFIELIINKFSINIFDFKINEKKSLIIECNNLIDFSIFEEIVAGIIYSFGLISGSLIREEILYLQYSDCFLQDISGFSYRRVENSHNGFTSIDPRLFAQVTDSKTLKTYYLTPSVFQNMVNNCIKDSRFLRAIKMITESSVFPLEIKAATYSVALETLKNIILEHNSLKTNPFKSKSKASNTIKELKKLISAIDDVEFNNKQSVLNKLDQLNQVGNKESFLLTFKLLSIPLSPDDEKCLENRNNFLHGKIPFENEAKDKNYKIQHIVYKLHMLLCSLILKYSGYNGFILNNIKLVDLMYFKKNINEPLLRMI